MVNSKTQFSGPRDFFNYFFKIYFPKIKSNIALVIINSNYSAYNHNDLARKINFTEKYFTENKVNTLYLGQTPQYYLT